MTKSESNPSSRYFGEPAPYIRLLMEFDNNKEREEFFERYEPLIDVELVDYKNEVTSYTTHLVEELKKTVHKNGNG